MQKKKKRFLFSVERSPVIVTSRGFLLQTAWSPWGWEQALQLIPLPLQPGEAKSHLFRAQRDCVSHSLLLYHNEKTATGPSWWLRQSRICPQYRRPRFDPWVRQIPWRRKWLPTPVFLPGESHGQRNLASYGPQGHKELDTNERLTHFTCSETVFITGLPRWH